MEKERDLTAAMDSVNLIDKTILLERTDENTDMIRRNSGHLKTIIERHTLVGDESYVFLNAIEQAENYLAIQ